MLHTTPPKRGDEVTLLPMRPYDYEPIIDEVVDQLGPHAWRVRILGFEGIVTIMATTALGRFTAAGA